MDYVIIEVPKDKIKKIGEMIFDGFKRNIAEQELAAWIELEINKK